MQSVIGGLCVVYWTLLTTALLVPDPEQSFRVRGNWHKLVASLMPYAHVIGFFVLAVLALAVRWPVPRWVVVVVLVAYGAATEIIQGFLPPRTADWADWYQDIAGILLAVAACWIASAVLRRWSATKIAAELTGEGNAERD